MYSPNHSPPTRRTARRIGPCPPQYADSLSGKTAFFNQVTGSNQKVANEVLNGEIEGIPIPDLVVCVVYASSLERHLHLALRVIDSGLPMILALNMVDLAEQSGLRLDPAKIAEELGVPVVPMQANAAKGIIDLKQSLRLPSRSGIRVHDWIRMVRLTGGVPGRKPVRTGVIGAWGS